MPIPDRQKQRREYLKKKAGAYGNKMLLCTLFFILLAAAIGCSIGCLLCLMRDHSILSCIFCTVSLLFGVLCIVVWEEIRFAHRHVKSIGYVPPVTPDTLPVEEILVRSYQEVEQEQKSVLLRAAEHIDVPAEELLRSVAE